MKDQKSLKPKKPRIKEIKIIEVEKMLQSKTTSIDVSKKFGKEHKNVLRDIKELIEQHSKEFGQLNFEPSNYLNKQGKTQPMYQMTFDGFMMLVMGYKGKQYAKIKEWYVTKFREMTEYIIAIQKYQATIDLTKKMNDCLHQKGFTEKRVRLYNNDVPIYQWLSNELNKHILGITSRDKARKHFNESRTSLSIREMVRQHDKKLNQLYISTENYLIDHILDSMDDLTENDLSKISNTIIILSQLSK